MGRSAARERADTDRAQPVASLRSFGLLARWSAHWRWPWPPCCRSARPWRRPPTRPLRTVRRSSSSSGPVGSFNRHYKADADALAKVARKYTKNVVLIKTPNATWPAVKKAAQGASIFVYLGHGNGWPSRYRDALWPFSQNGLGLDPATGADGTAHVYYGEAQVASEIRFAPNAVVLLFHLCYASGNTEPGLPTGTLADKKARVDNYGAGFFAAGARTVIADAYDSNTTYMSRLFTSARAV